MSNPIRIVSDNAADRASTLSSTGVSVLPITALQTNSKSEVWRTSATTTSATITVTFNTAEAVGAVALPFCNFSATATMRVRLYSDTACTALLQDSGTVLCAQGGGSKVQGLTLQQSASAYSFGGGVAATVWLTNQASTQGIKVDIVDSANLQGYLEAARLVVGNYYQADYNVAIGDVALSMEDTTVNFRTDAGNLLSDVGTRHKLLTMTLAFMSPKDRAAIWKTVKNTGISNPVFISVFPGSTDVGLEQEHTIYGKFTKITIITAVNYNVFSAPMEVEGI